MKNQCDGCVAGIPINSKGLHNMSIHRGHDPMKCEAERYDSITKEQALDFVISNMTQYNKEELNKLIFNAEVVLLEAYYEKLSPYEYYDMTQDKEII